MLHNAAIESAYIGDEPQDPAGNGQGGDDTLQLLITERGKDLFQVLGVDTESFADRANSAFDQIRSCH